MLFVFVDLKNEKKMQKNEKYYRLKGVQKNPLLIFTRSFKERAKKTYILLSYYKKASQPETRALILATNG